MTRGRRRDCLPFVSHPPRTTLRTTERMYSITEAAAAIGVERSTVRAWCKRGRMMGAVRVGKYAWHIPASTVANAVEYVASNHHVRLLGDPLTGDDAQIIELGVRIVAAADACTGDAA